MKSPLIPVLITAALVSAPALASDRWHVDDRERYYSDDRYPNDSRHNPWEDERRDSARHDKKHYKDHHKDHYMDYARHHYPAHPSAYGQTTYIYQSYGPPVVVYEQAPRVVYRDRVVYREVPVVQEPVYQERRYSSSSSPVLGQAIGAIAGGAIGSQIGKGNGRVAATAIGAVIGGAIGGETIGR